MQFQQDWPKDKKITALFFCLKTQKDIARLSFIMRLQRDRQFLYCSSTSRTLLDSSGLAEWKYAFFSSTGRNTKKLRRSNLYQLTIFKHGLLEGSTILLQYSAITRTPLKSSQLGELKYAISPGQDVRLKNNSVLKCKNDITRRAYMVTVLCVGPDKSGQVRTGVKCYFSSTVRPTLFKFGPPPNLRAVS